MTSSTARLRSPARIAAIAAALPAAAAVGWALYSALGIAHDLPLRPALDAERRRFTGRAGKLSYYVAGDGEPLLLVHSVNAAASAYEMGPLFEHYRATRRVYALDLPGFGYSDRAERDYTPRLMTDAVLDLVDQIGRESGSAPIDALALSLGGEFLARAALERPGAFGTIALVTPTGFGSGEQFYGPALATRGSALARRALEFPLWAQAFYDLLVTRASIRYFLGKTFSGQGQIDPGLIDYDYLTAHQPDARHAPYAFISGTLFSADIDRVYESIGLPAWLAYGRHDRYTDFGDMANVAARANWSIRAFDTGGIPWFERPGEFIGAYDGFLARAAHRAESALR